MSTRYSARMQCQHEIAASVRPLRRVQASVRRFCARPLLKVLPVSQMSSMIIMSRPSGLMPTSFFTITFPDDVVPVGIITSAGVRQDLVPNVLSQDSVLLVLRGDR